MLYSCGRSRAARSCSLRQRHSFQPSARSGSTCGRPSGRSAPPTVQRSSLRWPCCAHTQLALLAGRWLVLSGRRPFAGHNRSETKFVVVPGGGPKTPVFLFARCPRLHVGRPLAGTRASEVRQQVPVARGTALSALLLRCPCSLPGSPGEREGGALRGTCRGGLSRGRGRSSSHTGDARRRESYRRAHCISASKAHAPCDVTFPNVLRTCRRAHRRVGPCAARRVRGAARGRIPCTSTTRGPQSCASPRAHKARHNLLTQTVVTQTTSWLDPQTCLHDHTPVPVQSAHPNAHSAHLTGQRSTTDYSPRGGSSSSNVNWPRAGRSPPGLETGRRREN